MPTHEARLRPASATPIRPWGQGPASPAATRPGSAMIRPRPSARPFLRQPVAGAQRRQRTTMPGTRAAPDLTGTPRDFRQAIVQVAVRDDLDRVSLSPIVEQVDAAIHQGRPLRTLIIGEAIGPRTCHALAECLRATFFTSLTRISMWRADIADAGFLAFCATLPNLHRLSTLELIDCELADPLPCCSALSAALSARNAPKLANLALDHNRIGSEGLRRLGAALQRSRLRTLSLAFCDLDADSGPVLARLLIAPKASLRMVNLEGNRLGDVGLEHISAGVEANRSVSELRLGANHFGPPFDGLRRLCRSMGVCSSLRTVDLEGNALPREAVQLVLDAIPTCPHVRQLHIPKMTAPALYQAVQIALQHNRAARPKSCRPASSRSKERARQRIIQEFLRSQRRTASAPT